MSAGRILAEIGKDDGMTINCGGYSFKVGPESCEDCGADAEIIVQGETDSFGFETSSMCRPCNDKVESAVADQYNGENVEDRKGHFLVAECTNTDRGAPYDWTRYFTSLREAVGFYRRIENIAAPLSGLYPDNGVQEVNRALKIVRDDEGYDSVVGAYGVLKRHEMHEFLSPMKPAPPELIAKIDKQISGIFDKKEEGPLVSEDETVVNLSNVRYGCSGVKYNPYQKLNSLWHYMQTRYKGSEGNTTCAWPKDRRWDLDTFLDFITKESDKPGNNAKYSAALNEAVRALKVLQLTVRSETIWTDERNAANALKAIRPFW